MAQNRILYHHLLNQKHALSSRGCLVSPKRPMAGKNYPFSVFIYIYKHIIAKSGRQVTQEDSYQLSALDLESPYFAYQVENALQSLPAWNIRHLKAQ